MIPLFLPLNYPASCDSWRSRESRTITCSSFPERLSMLFSSWFGVKKKTRKKRLPDFVGAKQWKKESKDGVETGEVMFRSEK